MIPPAIQTGHMYALGEHRLLCADSTDATAVSRLFGSERASLLLTDPPYGIAYVEAKADFHNVESVHRQIANDHLQTEEEYRAFTAAWLIATSSHLTPKNAAYIFNSDKMLFPLREGMKAAGWKFAQLLIWVKTQAIVGRLDYLPQHELIAYGWHGTHAFHRSKDKSVLVYPKPAKSVLHPTMKPIGLLRRLILNSSRMDDCVYDPFGGSGSTLIACEQTKRRCFMVEMDPEYCRRILNRFSELTGVTPSLLSSVSVA